MMRHRAQDLMNYGVSSGYHRLGGNIPGRLVAPNKFPILYNDKRTPGDTTVADPRAINKLNPALEPGPAEPKYTAQAARQMGFTGSQCNKCNSMRMKVSGHCEVCEDCGETTGCS